MKKKNRKIPGPLLLFLTGKADDNRLQKTTEYYRKVRKYRKGKLDNIFRQLEIFLYSFKGSRIQKSKQVDECKYWKELQIMNQQKNAKKKGLGRASSCKRTVNLSDLQSLNPIFFQFSFYFIFLLFFSFLLVSGN